MKLLPLLPPMPGACSTGMKGLAGPAVRNTLGHLAAKEGKFSRGNVFFAIEFKNQENPDESILTSPLGGAYTITIPNHDQKVPPLSMPIGRKMGGNQPTLAAKPTLPTGNEITSGGQY